MLTPSTTMEHAKASEAGAVIARDLCSNRRSIRSRLLLAKIGEEWFGSETTGITKRGSGGGGGGGGLHMNSITSTTSPQAGDVLTAKQSPE